MITVNGTAHELAGCSVREVIDALAVSDRGVAVAVNGEVIAKSQWESTTISDGSVVEVVTAVAGG